MTLAEKVEAASAPMTECSAAGEILKILSILREASSTLDQVTLTARAGGEVIKLDATRPETIAALLGSPAEVVP